MVDFTSGVTAQIEEPTFKKTISIVANGGKVISGVTGVKGSAESVYRTGQVSISPEDLGLEKIECILIENDAKQGSVTDEQLQILKASKINGIVYNGYLYTYSMGDADGIMFYTACYLEDVGSLQILSIDPNKKTYSYTLAVGSSGGKIDDVKINDVSIVNNKVANINIGDGLAIDSESKVLNISDSVATKQYVDDLINAEINSELVYEGYYDEETDTFFKESGKINPLPKKKNKLYKDVNTNFVYALVNNKYTGLLLQATSSRNGLMKLYTTTGSNEDGTMSQKAITDSLNNITSVDEIDESLAIKIDF